MLNGMVLNGNSITNMETKLKEIKKELLKLKGWSEDLKARSQCNNVHVMGEREGAEAIKKPTEFIAGLLNDKLGLVVTLTLDQTGREWGNVQLFKALLLLLPNLDSPNLILRGDLN